MSKLNIFLVLLLAGLLTYAKIGSARASSISGIIHAAPSPTPTATPSPTPIPVGEPKTIEIPKISMTSNVVPVGTDFQGKMVMPEDWYTTAWYSGIGSHKPGEAGNAVIAGHLDTIYGTQGKFYYLNSLEVGDQVITYDSNGRKYTFVVVDKQTYDYDKVPLDKVFGSSDEKHLNLITCTGWYNRAMNNYMERLVVYTKLVE